MKTRKQAIRDVIYVIRRWVSSEIYGKFNFSMAVADELHWCPLWAAIDCTVNWSQGVYPSAYSRQPKNQPILTKPELKSQSVPKRR